MAQDWDSISYDQLPLPYAEWGHRVLERMDLSGDETVLDVGCGIGLSTRELLERLPNGRVIAVDGAVRMLSEMRRRLSDYSDRLEPLLADASRLLPIAESVDAVYSIATFHWVKDHDSLFSHLAAVTKSGGKLGAECGGNGNVDVLKQIVFDLYPDVAEHLAANSQYWQFGTVEGTVARLEAAGWKDVDVQVHRDPRRIDDPNVLRKYLKAVVLREHMDVIYPADRRSFVEAIAEAMPEPVITYSRLEIFATKA